jgi:hypothetical protein
MTKRKKWQEIKKEDFRKADQTGEFSLIDP